jgi:Protein of unknown function (DUF2844)
LRKPLHITISALFGLALLLIGPSLPAAHAALGGNASSMAADAAALHATIVNHVARAAVNAPAVTAYTIERMTTASGIAVDEYVGPAGKVFAVTWRGRRPPDLSRLLGSYFAQYRSAATAGGLTALGLHRASVRGSEVMVETAGHMRDMWGRAMLPSILPPDVEQSEIR